jgi:hypothetical protein
MGVAGAVTVRIAAAGRVAGAIVRRRVRLGCAGTLRAVLLGGAVVILGRPLGVVAASIATGVRRTGALRARVPAPLASTDRRRGGACELGVRVTTGGNEGPERRRARFTIGGDRDVGLGARRDLVSARGVMAGLDHQPAGTGRDRARREKHRTRLEQARSGCAAGEGVADSLGARGAKVCDHGTSTPQASRSRVRARWTSWRTTGVVALMLWAISS